MKKIYVSGFLLILLACVHARRGPASDELLFPRSQCEAAFNSLTNELDFNSDQNTWLASARRGFEYLRSGFPQEVDGLMDKSRPICERVQSLSEIQRDLKVKREAVQSVNDELSQRLAKLEDRLTYPMMRDSRFEERVSCVLDCSLKKAVACARLCQVDQIFVDQVLMDDAIVEIHKTCAIDGGDFNGLLRANLPKWRELVNTEIEVFRKMEHDSQLAQQDLQSIEIRLRKEKIDTKSLSCEASVSPSWIPSVSRAVSIVERKNTEFRSDDTAPEKHQSGFGTIFFIDAGRGEVRGVTAEHIYNENDRWGDFSSRAFKYSQTSQNMQPEPGLYNRGLDIIQTRVTGGRTASLRLIEAGAIPQIKQKFYLAGFPLVRDKKFTVYKCGFLGFSRSRVPRSTSTAYVLSCPNVHGHIGGMSGGPVVDEGGRVWGMISDHDRFLGRVYVAPLSMTPDGQVQMGIQQYFLSDQCFGDGEANPRRCQVMPN